MKLGRTSRYKKGMGKKVRVNIDVIKLRTRCARCGQVGHWAKACINEPDSRGRESAAKHGHGKGGGGGGAASFA